MNLEDLQELVRKNGISMASEPAETNPFIVGGSDDLRHWKCTITADGIAPLEVYCSFGDFWGEDAPEAAQVLALVCADVSTYRTSSGFSDWASQLGLDIAGDAGESAALLSSYEELGRISSQLDPVLSATLKSAEGAELQGAAPSAA